LVESPDQKLTVSGLQSIANALNDRGVRTARDGAWHNSTVRNLLAGGRERSNNHSAPQSH
jgi:hypothetical protein